jgi:hypothetical protein
MNTRSQIQHILDKALILVKPYQSYLLVTRENLDTLVKLVYTEFPERWESVGWMGNTVCPDSTEAKESLESWEFKDLREDQDLMAFLDLMAEPDIRDCRGIQVSILFYFSKKLPPYSLAGFNLTPHSSSLIGGRRRLYPLCVCGQRRQGGVDFIHYQF